MSAAQSKAVAYRLNGAWAYPLNGGWMGWLARTSLDWTVVGVLWVIGALVIGAVTLRLWQRSESDDRQYSAWIGTIVSGLLISPLGWSYYAPLLFGPSVSGRSGLLWVSYVLFCLPVEPLALRSLTIGSAPFWGYLVLFGSSLRSYRSPSFARTYADRRAG